MSGINKVILVGHLGKDPEVRNLEGGKKVANFSLATSESYNNKEGKRIEQTEWHNIAVWGGLADVAEKYLTKGRQVYLEGKIRSRSYDDKEGVKRYTTEIVGDTFTMLGKKEEGSSNGVAEKAETYSNNTSEAEGDLPF